MKKVINYAPYVYACRTGQGSLTKTFHVFILVPVAKSKSVRFFHQSTAGIERGISLAANTLGIHLEAKRGHSEFGDKIVYNKQSFWAGYISFEYTEVDSIPEADYEYSINLHKNKDGALDKSIKVLYGDAEELSQADFNELKDGDFALACPYAYLYKEDVKGQPTFFSGTLIPEIEKYSLATSFEPNKKEDDSTLLLPARVVTLKNIAIQVIKNAPFIDDQAAGFIEVSTNIDEEDGSLDVDYKYSRLPEIKKRGPGIGKRRGKKKMKVRTKSTSR